MKKYISITIVLYLLIAGCGNDISSKLTGKWVIDSDPETLTLELFKDGSVKQTYSVGATLEGEWKVESDSTAKIILDPWSLSAIIREKGKMLLKHGGKEKLYRKME